MRGGGVHGASDRYAAESAENPTRPADLAATVYHCLGVDPRLEIRVRIGRPLTPCDGQIIDAVLA